MNLLQKTTRLYIIATALVLVLAGVTLYVVLKVSVSDEMEEELVLQSELVAQSLAEGEHPHIPLTTITEVPAAALGKRIFGDTVVLDQVQKHTEDYHFYTVVKPIGGKYYEITVMDTYIGWTHYSTTILAVFLLMALLLGAAGAYINYQLTKTIWHPFFENLQQLQRFSVSSAEPLRLRESDINEFRELKVALEDLAARSRQEYNTLREFTENASHEIQTPLAIIRSKLDRLGQYPMSQEMSEHIVHAKVGTDRLTRMNKSLLLLARLDNRLFDESELVAFEGVVQEHVELMGELFSLKDVPLTEECNPVKLQANKYLCDVLVSNLLSNALRYTPATGKVHLGLTPAAFTVSNSGCPLEFPEERLFDRFKRSQAHPDGTGLGLAIVSEICKVHHWRPAYRYENGQHHFSVHFK